MRLGGSVLRGGEAMRGGGGGGEAQIVRQAGQPKVSQQPPGPPPPPRLPRPLARAQLGAAGINHPPPAPPTRAQPQGVDLSSAKPEQFPGSKMASKRVPGLARHLARQLGLVGGGKDHRVLGQAGAAALEGLVAARLHAGPAAGDGLRHGAAHHGGSQAQERQQGWVARWPCNTLQHARGAACRRCSWPECGVGG